MYYVLCIMHVCVGGGRGGVESPIYLEYTTSDHAEVAFSKWIE